MTSVVGHISLPLLGTGNSSCTFSLLHQSVSLKPEQLKPLRANLIRDGTQLQSWVVHPLEGDAEGEMYHNQGLGAA